jgi:hypothetical protein
VQRFPNVVDRIGFEKGDRPVLLTNLEREKMFDLDLNAVLSRSLQESPVLSYRQFGLSPVPDERIAG